MEEDIFFTMRQLSCSHHEELYTQRRFDILKGFEFNLTRCINCHKIVELDAKKLSK